MSHCSVTCNGGVWQQYTHAGSAPFWQHSEAKYWAIMLQFGPIVKGVALINIEQLSDLHL